MQNSIQQNVIESKQRKFQFMNVRYQLVGRGITGEISTLYVNGQQVKNFPTIDAFYNAMGQQGWEVRPLGMEQEGVYTYFVVMQREV
ncbi:hypothetical protein IQ230_01200 [Gloeocapsopsis crepidinum LEGE 06123]|uniref:DUF4177 domain-containing protein n=1 Tax=Gloeocapsopsis crepidinum LEGE 06123 TaxID=588587 RepID=A0ABR9UL38_9CHRO|nr:hypothetical protein [Gloeocapsopsis crepidinum]MBE9189004.1 hypothetical protein [Gloeocapsopsis crepidinum LEGE 06123]